MISTTAIFYVIPYALRMFHITDAFRFVKSKPLIIRRKIYESRKFNPVIRFENNLFSNYNRYYVKH